MRAPLSALGSDRMVSDFEAISLQKRHSDFYDQDALVLARALLGDVLVHMREGVTYAGRIVETEAYRGPSDRACHARVGLTKRTRTLLGAAGKLVVAAGPLSEQADGA